MREQSSLKELPNLRDYELLAPLAEGSMAQVYKARRRNDGTVVAVKVPLPNVANNDVLRERFKNEFRVGKSLDHPNIVRALDFGQEGSIYYLVMEFVEGQDLWQRIEEVGRLPEKEAVELIVQAARGLHEAHKNGIIHRDVKPENIMLDGAGKAKIGDLGLIKDLEADYNLTCPHKGLGTPNFTAPEQFTEARHADVRCDIYSLGATLYMAVTGILPFQAKTLAGTLRKKLNNDLVPPREIVPTLSESVDWAIRRAVQVDPQRRQASCLEFIQALTSKADSPLQLVGRGAEGVSPSKGSRPAKERRRAVRYPCTLASICEVATSIHGEETAGLDRWPAKVLNLSIAGIGLMLDRRFEPGTVVWTMLENSDRTFQFRADLQVIRSIRSGANQWFIAATFTKPLLKDDLRKLL